MQCNTQLHSRGGVLNCWDYNNIWHFVYLSCLAITRLFITNSVFAGYNGEWNPCLIRLISPMCEVYTVVPFNSATQPALTHPVPNVGRLVLLEVCLQELLQLRVLLSQVLDVSVLQTQFVVEGSDGVLTVAY